jgi:hypothetical protein
MLGPFPEYEMTTHPLFGMLAYTIIQKRVALNLRSGGLLDLILRT